MSEGTGQSGNQGQPLVPAPPAPASTDLFDGNFHIGAELAFSGDGHDTSLVCDDFGGLASGTSSVRLTQPFKLNVGELITLVTATSSDAHGKALRAQLETNKELLGANEGVNDDLALSIDALFIQPARSTITGDKTIVFIQISADLGGLKNHVPFLNTIEPVFRFNSAALRVMQCPADRKTTLLAYLGTLPALKGSTP